MLEDMDSKNGTLLNGQTFDEPTLLEDGDLIQIAVVQQFLFLESDVTLPLDADFQDLEQLPRDCYAWINALGGVDRQSGSVAVPLVSQFSLLEMLYEHQGLVVTRADLIKAIWGEEQAVVVSEQAPDALVRALARQARQHRSKPSLYNHRFEGTA